MPGWSDGARNAAVDAVGTTATATWVAAFEDDACTDEVDGGAYTRVQLDFPDSVAGAATAPTVTLNIPTGKTVRGVGRFSTASGGLPYDTRTIAPAQPFPSGGKLDVTWTITQP